MIRFTWYVQRGKKAFVSILYLYLIADFVKWCIWKYSKFKSQSITWQDDKWQEKPILFARC